MEFHHTTIAVADADSHDGLRASVLSRDPASFFFTLRHCCDDIRGGFKWVKTEKGAPKPEASPK